MKLSLDLWGTSFTSDILEDRGWVNKNARFKKVWPFRWQMSPWQTLLGPLTPKTWTGIFCADADFSQNYLRTKNSLMNPASSHGALIPYLWDDNAISYVIFQMVIFWTCALHQRLFIYLLLLHIFAQTMLPEATQWIFNGHPESSLNGEGTYETHQFQKIQILFDTDFFLKVHFSLIKLLSS